MATAFGVFKDCQVIINGVDLSDHCETVNFTVSQAALDNHAMGDESALIRPGLYDWSIDLNMFQDFAAGSVDATLWPLFSGRVLFAWTLKPVASSAVSATNPIYSGQGYITNFPPLDGAHGDNLMTTVTISPGTDFAKVTA